MSGEPKAPPKKSTMVLTALALIVFGFGVSAFNWYLALTDNSYYAAAALVTPFMGFIGVAMLIAPDPAPPGVVDSARLRIFRRQRASSDRHRSARHHRELSAHRRLDQTVAAASGSAER